MSQSTPIGAANGSGSSSAAYPPSPPMIRQNRGESVKILEASIADQAKGGLGNAFTVLGRAAGMPYNMMAFGPMEWVVTPRTTYI
jgi:hypothetical protein